MPEMVMERQTQPAVDPEPDDLWHFRVSGNVEQRNQIIEDHLCVVNYHAEKIHRRLPDTVELDDLKSAGIFGLVDAVKNFDVSRNVKFKTYCSQRIRGAILDSLRKADWVPRLIRSKHNKLNAARTEIESQTGRPASEEQLASALDITIQELRKLLSGSPTQIVSLSDSLGTDENGRSLTPEDFVQSQREVNPVESLHKRDLLKCIASRLTRKERVILMMYYFDGMTMKQIGFSLNLSESRVCQLHSRMLEMLKREFCRDDFEPIHTA